MAGALTVPVLDIDRDPAHDAARHELAKPMYGTRPSPLQQFRDWIDDHVIVLLSKAAGVPGSWFTITVLAIVLGVAAAVAVRMARRAMRSNRGADYRMFASGELSAAEHRRTAEAYADRAEWAGAIRHRLRAVARSLEESGMLQPTPGRTASELARVAGAARPELAGEFVAAARIFNDVSYGGEPGSEAGYRLVAELDERLWSPASGTVLPAGAGVR